MRVTNAVTAERKFDLALLFEAELTQRPGPRPPPAADRAEARRNWARFQETSRRVGSSPEREVRPVLTPGVAHGGELCTSTQRV